MKILRIASHSLVFSLALLCGAQITTKPPVRTEAKRIRNIAPDEMWKRVERCVFPIYSELSFNSHIVGTVDIGLGISPDGDVANDHVLDGPPLLVQPAVDAIRQWKFRPNVVRGEATWSRVRALVRFNADGTTSVDLSPAFLADDFGDPGTTRAVAGAVARPASAPVCKSVQQWTEAEAKELKASEVGPGYYRNNYFGLTIHFPIEWQVSDLAMLNSIDEDKKRSAESQRRGTSPRVQVITLPTYTLFAAQADAPRTSVKSSVQFFAQKEIFVTSTKEYFQNFLTDSTADGTRGPEEMEISGLKFHRCDRWGKVSGVSIYQISMVTHARGFIIGIDLTAGSAAEAEELVKIVKGIRTASSH